MADDVSGAAVRGSEWTTCSGLLFASIVCATCAVIPLTIVGVLVRPLANSFGWSRATISAAVLLTAFGTLGLAPVVGPLVDRIGPRKIALFGLPLVAAGTASIGLTGPSAISWYAGWAAFAVTQAFANPVVWSNAIVSRFDRHRGTALGLMLAGQAMCFGGAPLLSLWILEKFGWRWIFFSAALLTVVVAWPLAWRFFYAARDLSPVQEAACAAASDKPAPSARLALQTGPFWQIAVSFLIAALAVSALIVHLQPILIDSGVSPQRAASVLLIIGPASIAGRLFSGMLLDRLPAHAVASMSLLFPATAYAILIMFGQSVGAAYVNALLIGLASGAEADILAYIVSRYFPRDAYSSIYSILLGIYAVGYGLAPVAAGAVFDATSSYHAIFAALLGAALFGAVLILSLGEPRRLQLAG